MFITLTTACRSKRPIYIVAEKVVSILPQEDGTTYVYCTDARHNVREHHDDIKLLVELTIKEGKENG